jgi:hypothetical protein
MTENLYISCYFLTLGSPISSINIKGKHSARILILPVMNTNIIFFWKATPYTIVVSYRRSTEHT